MADADKERKMDSDSNNKEEGFPVPLFWKPSIQLSSAPYPATSPALSAVEKMSTNAASLAAIQVWSAETHGNAYTIDAPANAHQCTKENNFNKNAKSNKVNQQCENISYGKHTHRCTHTHTHRCIFIYLYTYVCVCAQTCVRVCLCMHTFIAAYTSSPRSPKFP